MGYKKIYIYIYVSFYLVEISINRRIKWLRNCLLKRSYSIDKSVAGSVTYRSIEHSIEVTCADDVSPL